MLQHKCQHGLPATTALLISALVAPFAANVALVTFVADRLSPTSSSPVTAGRVLASNENLLAVTKIAA